MLSRAKKNIGISNTTEKKSHNFNISTHEKSFKSHFAAQFNVGISEINLSY